MGDGGRREFLVAQPCAEHPTQATVNRLAHEHGLKDYLDSEWALRPLELVRERGQTMLVLEPTTSRPLDEMIGQGLPIGTFLRLAIAVSNTVARLHHCGLVHKDIKASNILIDAASGDARLTGFGIASRLPRERQPLEPPELIAGTLSHMAPEQTGRMNRSIDSRSDLYSLGITLLSSTHRKPSLQRPRTDGVGALPHREKAGAAEIQSRRNSAAACRDRHEAAREDARGALPDCGGGRA